MRNVRSASVGSGDIDGTLAQYVVVEHPWVVLALKNLSFEEAAAFPVAAGAAINVIESVKFKQGMTVVTQGTGGVSCFMIQVSNLPAQHPHRIPGIDTCEVCSSPRSKSH